MFVLWVQDIETCGSHNVNCSTVQQSGVAHSCWNVATAAGASGMIIRRQLWLQLRLWMRQTCLSQVCTTAAKNLYLSSTFAHTHPFMRVQGDVATGTALRSGRLQQASGLVKTLMLLPKLSIGCWVLNSNPLSTYIEDNDDVDLLKW